jgi:hypothetical protein
MDSLVVFNGLDQLGIYNNNTKEIIKIKGVQESYTLEKILLNEDYIVLVFNHFYSIVFIINRKTGTINQWKLEETISQCVLWKNKLIITNLFNTMSCYNMKKELLWNNQYNYSRLFFDINQEILIDKKMYWVFNKNTIHILNINNGQIEETINLSNKHTIIEIILLKNQLIIMTDRGLYVYNKISLELIHYIEDIFPISKSTIHNNILHFHDNQFLYKYDINGQTLKKIPLHHKQTVLLEKPLLLDNNIIIPTNHGFWYILNGDKVIKKSLLKLWSGIKPEIYYNNKIVFYQNFSFRYFKALDLNQLLVYK